MSDEPEPETPREWVAWYITPLLPDTWIITAYVSGGPETADRPVVEIVHNKIEKQPAAPLSNNLVNSLTIRILSPYQDPDRAENELDGQVLDLITILRSSERLVWTLAEKIRDERTKRLAWDISVQVLTTHTPPAE